MVVVVDRNLRWMVVVMDEGFGVVVHSDNRWELKVEGGGVGW